MTKIISVSHWKEGPLLFVIHSVNPVKVNSVIICRYMATSGVDRTLKIWDMRTYKMMQSYKIPVGAGQLAFSQRGLLAAGMGSVVQVRELNMMDSINETTCWLINIYTHFIFNVEC